LPIKIVKNCFQKLKNSSFSNNFFKNSFKAPWAKAKKESPASFFLSFFPKQLKKTFFYQG
jgi:hypothetical protein